jgi:three-Cys-motif partner protein
MTEHRFGGPWTEENLARLRKYLRAYMKIFGPGKRGACFRAVYVDAFAGTGFRKDPSSQDEDTDTLFDEAASDLDVDAWRKGSAEVALETEPPFAEYVFIKHASSHPQELSRLHGLHPALSPRIRIVREDANTYLRAWCATTDWGKTRAVVFLDPYGMQVEWSTIVAMAETRGVDLWILFPLAMGVNRLLPKSGPPHGARADRLTRILGTEEWRNAFYRQSGQQNLFGGPSEAVKDADFERIADFWVERLKTAFPAVAPNPLPLRNSRNVPMYLLSFAAANPKGSKIALKIVQNILSR